MTETAAIADQIFRQLGDRDGTVGSVAYVTVPGNEHARWLLPEKRPEIGSVLASWAPYRLRSRGAWAMVRAANRMGRVAAIPRTSVLQANKVCDSDWSLLGWRCAESPVPVIYLGTPGPQRKAVVHLVERESGRCRAVVKVPLTNEAKIAILREADALQALGAEHVGSAPRSLHTDRAKGITTQSFVEGRSGSRKLGPEKWRLLRSLLLAGETTSLAEYVPGWKVVLESCADDWAKSQCLAAIDQVADDSPLPACWGHGDFAPWNIKQLADGRCALLDWEDARRGGLPLLDVYHFLHIRDFLFDARPRVHATEIMPEANEMGVTSALCQKLEGAYLVEAYLKCVQRNNRERAEFLSKALALWRRRAA